MLRLKSLTISKFRSFKHAELHFSKGFTCIVGPNGSGKSSICYSLMFGLGESSLRRLDGAKMLCDLINNKVTYSAGVIPKAMVKIELDGDEKYEIVRIARADGKSRYRVNGKKYSRQEVVEILKKHKFDVNDTNTIAQSEINRLVNLNPKDTRQLIDEASGIKEFEDKKQEAMRELEKVSNSVGSALMVLSERKGFLQDLKIQKEAAERYIAMKSRLNSLNYSKSHIRLKESQKTFDEHSSEMALCDAEKQKLLLDMNAINSKIGVLNEERQMLTKELTGKNASSSDVARSLEAIKTELARIGVEMENFEGKVTECNSNIGRLEQTHSELSRSVFENSALINEALKRIDEITPDLSKFDFNKADPAEIDTKIKEAEEQTLSLQSSLDALIGELSQLSIEYFGCEARISEMAKVIDENKDAEKMERSLASDAKSKCAAISQQLQKSEGKVTEFESMTKKAEGKLSSIDTDLIKYKEQRMLAYSRESSITDRISKAFGEKGGFFGSASQLCSYDPKYALAIEASAANRLNYLVVDTISTASRIIEYLKSNEIGRAAFIPVSDLNHTVTGERDAHSMIALTSLVKCDAKFKKVFDYIFGNTYLIDDIRDSNKFGVAKHRYVTLSGELVEQSGVVFGGALLGRLSLASLNARLEELESQKKEFSKQKIAHEGSLSSAKKEHALAQMQMEKLRANESDANASADMILKRIANASKELLLAKEKLAGMGAALEEKTRSKRLVEEGIATQKEALRRLLKELSDLTKKLSKSAMSKSEREEYEKLKGEFEGLKTKKTSLEKENEMNAKRLLEIAEEIGKYRSEMAKQKMAMQGKEERKTKLEGDRQEMELRIMKSNRASEDAYKKIQITDLDISKLGSEKGRVQSEIDTKERRITEHRIIKGQLETRICDLKAELATFDGNVEAIKESIESIEQEAAVISSKISELGNVNLKAPEAYEEKSRNVQEAMSKVETLNAEREAVMKMIEEIDTKKMDIFMQTFTAVDAHFRNIYKYVFPGNAYLELGDLKDPLNCGLAIKVEGDRSRRGVGQMSGGQKALLTLMLLFSIHMYKPSSIYILDEVDAALDKENSKKLSHIIKQLSLDSQFIVVSHNDSLVVESDVAIGVAFDKAKNESRAMGLEISSISGGAVSRSA